MWRWGHGGQGHEPVTPRLDRGADTFVAGVELLEAEGRIVRDRAAGMIGGAVVTENVFAWPGVGRLLTRSVADRDLSLVQGIVVLVAITMVSANLLVDLASGCLAPRGRLGGPARPP